MKSSNTKEYEEFPPSDKVEGGTFHSSDPVRDGQETDKSGHAGFTASYVNLVKTIIGAGILVLPDALMKMGLLLGLVMMFVAAGLCVLGLHLLNVAAMQLGRKASFSGLCSITYPHAAFVFELAIAVKCIGAGISYLSIVGKTSKSLAEQLLGLTTGTGDTIFTLLLRSKAFWTIFFAVAISPVCFMRKMDSLKYTSFGGIAAVFYLVLLTIWNFFNTTDASFSKIPVFVSPSLSMCSAYSAFVFAFTCHQNILPIQNEAGNTTPGGMMSIIGPSVGTANVLYLLVSVFGAATYGNVVKGVLLDSFGNEMPFTIARVMYILLLVLSFPLQVFPCRICIDKMVSTISPSTAKKVPNTIYLFSTVGIIALCSGIGALDYEVNKALGWVGATAGTFICYFLPAIIYNKLYMGTRMNWRRISAIGLFFAGGLTMVLAVIGLIMAKDTK